MCVPYGPLARQSTVDEDADEGAESKPASEDADEGAESKPASVPSVPGLADAASPPADATAATR